MSKFEEMGFTPGILKAIEALGFEQPMPVQEKVIPLLLGGESDIIALAQTGTGKTHAFAIPMVQRLAQRKGIGLVLAPTRE
ncbi:MAG: ATP-dependent RNA helicase, partial [Odoribacter sp.]|nr:ATP-dependent RNA helicase [Odoribacter sp.]